MRVRWVSASKEPQQVLLGDGKLVNSDVTTFTQKDMCGKSITILLVQLKLKVFLILPLI